MKVFNEYPVVILCGGKGERLRPLTETIPKPLVSLADQPMLAYIIDHLHSQEVAELVFCVGYKANLVIDFVNAYCHKREIPFSIIDSGVAADIAERLADAALRYPDGFFFCYGDAIADVPLAEVLEIYEQNDAIAVLSTFQLRSSFGIMEMDESKLMISYQEKPHLPYWINIGYGFLGPEALQILTTEHSMKLFLTHLVETNRLYAYPHRGVHITFNNLAEKEEAERAIHTFNY